MKWFSRLKCNSIMVELGYNQNTKWPGMSLASVQMISGIPSRGANHPSVYGVMSGISMDELVLGFSMNSPLQL